MKLAATAAIGAPAVAGTMLAIQGVRFDGTVTLGTLVVVATAALAVLGVILRILGAKYFPSKEELVALRTHVTEQLAAVRQDVHNAVGTAENIATREASALSESSAERHDRTCKDLERLEKLVAEAAAGSRTAQVDAASAVHKAEMAGVHSQATGKIVEKAMDQLDKESK